LCCSPYISRILRQYGVQNVIISKVCKEGKYYYITIKETLKGPHTTSPRSQIPTPSAISPTSPEAS